MIQRYRAVDVKRKGTGAGGRGRAVEDGRTPI